MLYSQPNKKSLYILYINLVIALTSRVAVNLLAMEMSFHLLILAEYQNQAGKMLSECTVSALFLKSPYNRKTDIEKAKCKKDKLVSKL